MDEEVGIIDRLRVPKGVRDDPLLPTLESPLRMGGAAAEEALVTRGLEEDGVERFAPEPLAVRPRFD